MISVNKLLGLTFAGLGAALVGRVASFYLPELLLLYRVGLLLAVGACFALSFKHLGSVIKPYLPFICVLAIALTQLGAIDLISWYPVLALGGYIVVSGALAAASQDDSQNNNFADTIVAAGVLNALLMAHYHPDGLMPDVRIGKVVGEGIDYGANNNDLAFAFSTWALVSLKRILYSRAGSIATAAHTGAFLLFVYMVMKTGSRGIGLAFLAGLLPGLIGGFFGTRSSRLKKLWVGSMIGLLVLGVVVGLLTSDLPFLERVTQTLDANRSVQGSDQVRLDMIEKGIGLFMDKPLVGHGFDSYRFLAGYGTYSHNDWVEMLVGVGVIGTAFYMAGLWMIITTIYKRSGPGIAWWVASLTVFILLSQMTLVLVGSLEFWVFIGFSLGAANAESRDDVKAFRARNVAPNRRSPVRKPNF
jgi:O-antigen ligase